MFIAQSSSEEEDDTLSLTSFKDESKDSDLGKKFSFYFLINMLFHTFSCLIN